MHAHTRTHVRVYGRDWGLVENTQIWGLTDTRIILSPNDQEFHLHHRK